MSIYPSGFLSPGFNIKGCSPPRTSPQPPGGSLPSSFSTCSWASSFSIDLEISGLAQEPAQPTPLTARMSHIPVFSAAHLKTPLWFLLTALSFSPSTWPHKPPELLQKPAALAGPSLWPQDICVSFSGEGAVLVQLESHIRTVLGTSG